MRIRDDKNLQLLAEAAGVESKEMGEAILKSLLAYDSEIDNEDNYGLDIVNVLDEDIPLSKLGQILDEAGLCRRNEEIMDAFFACRLMGDGDCPECGSEMNYNDTIGHEDNDGDYYTPNGYIVDYEVYVCPNCGEIKKIYR